LKIPGVIFFSKFLFFPNYDLDLFSVIGKPIVLPQISEPTNEEIDHYHQVYVDSLKSLYDRYKKRFNCSDQLEII